MILGFKEGLVAPVLAGTKVHTFREGSRWQPGQLIHFYTNVRQANMRQFRPATAVASVQRAELSLEGMRLDGRLLGGQELNLFAQRDGFADAAGFLAFFAGRPLPIVGQLVHWTPFRYLHPGVVEAPAVIADYLCQLFENRPGDIGLTAQASAQLRGALTAVGQLLAKQPWHWPCTVGHVLGYVNQNRGQELLRSIGWPGEQSEAFTTPQMLELLEWFVVLMAGCPLDVADMLISCNPPQPAEAIPEGR